MADSDAREPNTDELLDCLVKAVVAIDTHISGGARFDTAQARRLRLAKEALSSAVGAVSYS